MTTHKITNAQCDEFTDAIIKNIEAPSNPNRHDLTELQKQAITTAVIVNIQLKLGISIEESN